MFTNSVNNVINVISVNSVPHPDRSNKLPSLPTGINSTITRPSVFPDLQPYSPLPFFLRFLIRNDIHLIPFFHQAASKLGGRPAWLQKRDNLRALRKHSAPIQRISECDNPARAGNRLPGILIHSITFFATCPVIRGNWSQPWSQS